jgi:hypothetical protein
VWLDFNHTETFFDHMDWKGEVRDQYSLTFGRIIIGIWFENPKITFYAWVPED